MVAISEEFFFRGFILTNFQRAMSLRSAVLLSSLVFALVHIWNSHFGWIGFVNIFLSGVLASILYLKSDNLSGPIGIHFSWNLLQNLLGFAVSGQKLDGLFFVEYQSDEIILTGGEFGLEGSLFLIPITIAFILLLWNKGRKSNLIFLKDPIWNLGWRKRLAGALRIFEPVHETKANFSYRTHRYYHNHDCQITPGNLNHPQLTVLETPFPIYGGILDFVIVSSILWNARIKKSQCGHGWRWVYLLVSLMQREQSNQDWI